MKVIEHEDIVPFDVDDTLVMHCPVSSIPPGERVDVYDAVTGGFIPMRMNKPMIRLLKETSHRGSYVIVWSRGGCRWAADVVKALDLVLYVDHVQTKFTRYCDDTPVDKWAPDRIYLGPDVLYKQNVTKQTTKTKEK